ncbi:isoprenylcysteine carboxylmethyltransferase family protein [Pseudoxanthomonas winnipegensis]|uniref:Isoprenylcysteine carboxylmethyltransferase family protein n=1 Tax=Pseudoxanthomonas winnipegensis TaxID=2480810 RepID=A0A4Q8LRQ2_9GAMM|nr:isoprenylcysteine carboxylmethyltransferase family protein [Pseudoxanthomonas winnipegensis]TAA33300.1 isoprenylcysteine carboxylmethyltransferase family protein [Pseudoxanthomonas winnipegensis]TAA44113.1 isoprenylcysteine carboxylmethyltransferase family protein [Pseudoxanthomonas winnipegensis]TBV73376.1 isoprenylcysteine carboxylmethyltransferase family protein [Pseudoxanthomonas winnipegensis]
MSPRTQGRSRGVLEEHTLEGAARLSNTPLLVRLTAPVHFLLAFGLAALAQRMLALPLPQGGALLAMQWAGSLLALAALGLALWCFALFATRRTTILPSSQPSSLVERGPYRLTRNPMYVSLLASYIGLAGYLVVPWALVLLPLPWLALRQVVIPFEEARLRAEFGPAYARYCARVRRWL